MLHFPSPNSRSMAPLVLALALCLGRGVRRDLDVGVPPGSALDWGQQFPGSSPPRLSHLASSRQRKRSSQQEESRSQGGGPIARIPRATSSTPILSILTWDIPQHLVWIDNSQAVSQGPSSEPRASERPAAPRYGQTFYWTTLAPLFRILLHPRLVSRAELSAHVLELGDACIPALKAASAEAEIRELCQELLLRLRPQEPAEVELEELADSTRHRALKRFAIQELLRHEPYDVTAPFGARLFLLSDLFLPILVDLAAHSSRMEVRRNAASALARYDSREAVECLLRISERSEDQVLLIRALNGLGRFPAHTERLDWAPLVERLQGTADPVRRVAILGALGRCGVAEAFDVMQASLQVATKRYDTDEIQAILQAWFQLADSAHAKAMEADLERLLARLQSQGKRFGPLQKPGPTVSDVPDREGQRANSLKQLATLLRARLETDSEKASKLVLSLLDDRAMLRGEPGQVLAPLLAQITPVAQLRFFEGLTALRDPEGLAFLSGLARMSSGVPVRDPRALGRANSYGALALGLLPPLQRVEAARLAMEHADPEIQLAGLENLIALGDSKLQEHCAKLLQQLKACDLKLEGALKKTLFRRALEHLSNREKLGPQDALALQKHLLDSSPEDAALKASPRFHALLRQLVQQAAAGAQKTRLRKKTLELLELLPEANRVPLMTLHGEREVLRRVQQLLAGARSHAANPGYLTAIENEIRGFLFMQAVRPVQPVLQGVTFEPPVDLRETILLSMGRMRHPVITELIHNALASEDEEVRARACIAMGMTQDKRAALRLLPALGSRDAFTRLCAAQALDSLVKGLPFVDWLYAAASVRGAAMQELKQRLESERGR